ncbi:MAG: aminotransferase class I/II-fold pyridoxal phosphate-dependent enzyme [Clostridia bacterium]|nr:aminotransferase class I/II-fold pyridoxal phosphate-dependent enzyme [Clostridia bacterium]
MLSFENDYSEGAHPKLLQALMDTNLVQQVGYGEDEYSLRAKVKIRAACQDPEADVFFLVGGTQTNAVVIDGLLSGTEGVVAASTGHVNVHEAGAIEYTGHKVLTVPEKNGKIDAEDLRALLSAFYADPTHSHMVYPGAVYISHPTEYGSLYSLAELTALKDVCRAYGVPLFMDGARLGYGLMSYETDVTLPDIARLCDAFYIGGTKVGALCGEALVFPRHGAPKRFITHIKQHGAMVAKGRLIGVQFDALFTDGLYFDISRHAIDMTEKMKQGLAALGIAFFRPSPTNQQFVILENDVLERLKTQVRYSYWQPCDETRSVVRFAASWATREEDVDALLKIIRTQGVNTGNGSLC